jgi:hypothetical protein
VEHEPDRPQIYAAASAIEAAAIVAAIQRFRADTAPPPVPARRESGWLRAARVEAVERDSHSLTNP